MCNSIIFAKAQSRKSLCQILNNSIKNDDDERKKQTILITIIIATTLFIFRQNGYIIVNKSKYEIKIVKIVLK